MEIIKWSKDLETGIKTFDEEHKYLVKTLNDIFELIKKGEKEKAKLLLKERVIEYATKHFKHEEKIMERYKYPEYEKHKKTHELFVKTLIEKLIPKIENGSDNDFRSAVSFLIGWISMHIINVDKKYGKWFKENSIEINDEPFQI
ncbi:hemerythrin sipunculid [Methanocaldococcus villosus KIN24-T80]|uniref:Bacteriohemerythrin n=1 Tax=Methanocaldococcus villosus KIN24-T80 TaxID=1069083 RepID=N6UVH0_9EURY|nr:hemerythrin family protein [Methanocaldococcus villosus]ENN96349.1 hemerythrin sipunculid [Methanocaldococcus villosus KIN24-T80]